MAETWQDFESDCFNYLRKNYPNATFQAFGRTDSTRPDIYVISSHGTSFYMETKSSNAQCGQFVLIPNEIQQRFDYSKKNKTPIFESTRKIINHMDEYFPVFINAGTSGESINLNKSLFYDWIVSYYSSKGVKYFITKSIDYLIFPIERFSEYFDVSCCYRMKRSGSTVPGYSNVSEIESILQKNNIQGDLKFLGKELYLTTPQSIDGIKLRGETYTYMFRADANSNYLIRKLSNTCNSNVIFQISLKKLNQDTDDLLQFADKL